MQHHRLKDIVGKKKNKLRKNVYYLLNSTVCIKLTTVVTSGTGGGYWDLGIWSKGTSALLKMYSILRFFKNNLKFIE